MMPTTQPTMPQVMLFRFFFLFLATARRGAALATPVSAVVMSALVIMLPVPCRRTK